MSSLKKYNEVCDRYQVIGGRKFNEGSIVRTVSLSDRDAAIMNEMTGNDDRDGHGMKYVLVEKSEKEIRVELFKKAAELGLNPAKNIKTDDLKSLIENKAD